MGTAVPPVVPLSTTLTNVSRGGIAVFVIVQVTSPPDGTVTVAPLAVAPVHDHADGWYPIGPPDSASV